MITDQELETFCKAATAKRNAYYDRQGLTTAPRDEMTFTRGPKFARIVVMEQGRSTSVFCFVDLENGAILKAAGWKTPAKHARGNIANGAADVGPYGPAYLR